MSDFRKFSHTAWDAIVAESYDTIKSLSLHKGGEYAGDEDRLANFRRNAADCGTNMELVWRVYAGKHWDAISQYIQDLQKGKERHRLESLPGRADDLIVYLLLFKAILQERENPLKG